jgi:hypothetical protein
MAIVDRKNVVLTDAPTIKAMSERIESLEKQWLIENRILDVLVAGRIVSKNKVQQAREIVEGFMYSPKE